MNRRAFLGAVAAIVTFGRIGGDEPPPPPHPVKFIIDANHVRARSRASKYTLDFERAGQQF